MLKSLDFDVNQCKFAYRESRNGDKMEIGCRLMETKY